MTVAQRKALQRERDRKERPAQEQSIEAHLLSAGQAILAGDTQALDDITKEMQRRAVQLKKLT